MSFASRFSEKNVWAATFILQQKLFIKYKKLLKVLQYEKQKHDYFFYQCSVAAECGS